MPVEVFNKEGRGPFVFTCEHASNNTHDHEVSEGDAALVDEHWGYDIGAAHVTRALSTIHDAPAVLADFSRLLVDANRAPDDPTLFLQQAHDRNVDFNRNLDDEERHRRLERFYRPYHRAVRSTIEHAVRQGPRYLVSIHSFTRLYCGIAREIEVGVLFDTYADDAQHIHDNLARDGFFAALNEPYSGLGGLIYSIQHHARGTDTRYLELEIRQDLIDTEDKARAVAQRIAPALQSLTERLSMT